MAVIYTKKDQGKTLTTGGGIPSHSAIAGDEYTDTTSGIHYVYTTSWEALSNGDNYVTGGTYSSGTLTLNRQNGSVTITGFTSDIYTTGFTYNNANTLTISDNGGNNYSATINTMTGLTINGAISATTYQNLPIDPDNYVTGGTFSSGTLTLNRQNGSVTINGLVSGDTNIYNIDGTLTNNRVLTLNGKTLTFNGDLLKGDVIINPTGQVTLLAGASDGGILNLDSLGTSLQRAISIKSNGILRWLIQNNGVELGSNTGTNLEFERYDDAGTLLGSAFKINRTNGNVGINNTTPSETLDVSGKTKTTTLQITSGAVNNYVLTSDASGNSSWEPVTNSGALTGITINNNTNNYLLTATGTANSINGESGARFDGVTLDLTKSSTSPNIIISDLGNTTTDAYIRIEASSAGTPTYAIGVDKSDLNKFKITYASNSTASPGSTKLFDIDYGSALPIYSLAYDSVLFNTAPDAGQIELHNRSSSITSSFTQFAGFASLSANNGDTGDDYFYINNDSVSGLTSFGGGGVNGQMLLVNENRVDLPGITGGNGLYIKNDLSVNGLVRVGTVTSTGVAVYRNATTGILTTTSSDERVKQNITQITGATEIVKNLTGVYYNWKNTEHFQTEDESRQIGLIAQEVEPHLPEAVVLNGISDYKTIKYSEMVSVLVESIKEQQLIIEDLKQRIINLENK
jgi:hypothetical protein